MFRLSRKLSVLLALCLILSLFFSAGAFAASYSNVYGLTLTRIRVRESASTSGTLFDNIEQDRIVYVTESKDSGGTTFLHVKYRTFEGKTENGWIAQSSGGSTLVEILSADRAQSEYGVSGGDLPKTAAGTKSASEREALRAQDTAAPSASTQTNTTETAAPTLNASSATISDVQMKLRALGIYAGEITGRAGDKTISAIKAFQKKIGLDQTGQLTKTTLSRLDEAYAALSTSKSSSQGDEPTVEGVNSGVSARTIEQVQTMLKALGFYSGDITGNAGEKTITAIKGFQSQYGLTVDGIVGKATLSKINEVYSASQTGESNAATETQNAAPEETAASQTASSGTIRQVQEKLRDLGFYNGEITGKAGDKTTAAIKAFQKQYGLTADGIAGNATLSKLNEVYSNQTAAPSKNESKSSDNAAPSSTIKQVQEKLKTLGFYNGEITGNTGSKTTAAIKAFQTQYGLIADGIPGSATLAKLDEVYAAAAKETEDSKKPVVTTAPNSNVSSSTIKQVQQKLKDLGFYSGEVTGNSGDKTVSAIKAFQAKYGLSADGIIGSSTLQKLDEVYNASMSPKTNETPAESTSPNSNVSSSTIKQVQQKLKDLGFYAGEVTGNAGNKTTAAIKAFQQKYGLNADGIIGSSTLQKLDEVYNASQKTEATPTPAVSGNSSTIKQVQQKLKELGFYSGEITGNTGSKTTAAIKAFQKKYGLTEDGILGNATLKKLDEVYSAANKSSTPDTTSAPKSNVSASTIKTVQKQLKELGFYSGEVTGTIGNKTTAAIKAFQRKYGLTTDGVLGNSTVSKINSVYKASNSTSTSSSSSSSTKKRVYSVDWFKAKNNKLFGQLGLTKGHSLRLTDLNSGKSLNVTIQSAGNHLDVEPSTSADTEKFLSIYHVDKASKITFLRRAGIVTTETGYRIVCSYYGQPHGSQLILTNHFNGQFCIHFLNSKTHGSGVVDGDHQACIRQAVAHYGSSNVKIIRTKDDL